MPHQLAVRIHVRRVQDGRTLRKTKSLYPQRFLDQSWDRHRAPCSGPAGGFFNDPLASKADGRARTHVVQALFTTTTGAAPSKRGQHPPRRPGALHHHQSGSRGPRSPAGSAAPARRHDARDPRRRTALLRRSADRHEPRIRAPGTDTPRLDTRDKPLHHVGGRIVHHQQFLDGERFTYRVHHSTPGDRPRRRRTGGHPRSRRVREHGRLHRCLGRRQDRDAVPGRLLDAAGGLREDHQAPSRRRRPARTSRSPSPTAPPATRAARSRPACRPTSSLLARDRHDPPGRGQASSPPTGTPTQYKGMVTDSVVVARHPQGQPEEHQDLGRPDQARRRGHHAQPVHLGCGALEHHGAPTARSRQGRQDRGAGRPPTSTKLFKNVPVQDDSARKALQTFTGGKGDVLHLLRERGDLRPAERPGHRLHRARRHDPDREPGRGHLDQQAPEAGQGVPRLRRIRTPARRSSPTTATARSSTTAWHRGDRTSRRPSGLFTISDLGGWDARDDEVLRPRQGHRRRHRARPRASRSRSRRRPRPQRPAPARAVGSLAARPAPPATAEAAPSRCTARATGARPRHRRHVYLSLIVLIPLAAVVWRVARTRGSAASGTRSPRPRPRRR